MPLRRYYRNQRGGTGRSSGRGNTLSRSGEEEGKKEKKKEMERGEEEEGGMWSVKMQSY